jgi:flavodoxin
MNSYWVTFESQKSGCVDADTKELAEKIAENLGNDKVKSCERLPYPATPRMNNISECPAFCITPEKCKGRSSCPLSYACSE